MKSADEQLQLLEQGVEKLYTRDELRQKLAAGRPLRVKLGCDPTAPDLHLGHSVVLRKMRQFQDLGHKAIFIIGDYTALIGDPTGQNKTRPMLGADQIKRNADTYFQQAGKILDMSPDKLEIHFNSEWLAQMNLADTIRLASQMTVARMLERDTFETRYKADVPIGIHEFLYPLMQGHDSVVIRSDVELGGTDQTFNNLVGRDLQKDAGQQPQVVLIMPILEGLDGVEKMSKSKGNYIGLTESPADMFGKTMSISDAMMPRWYTLLLARPIAHEHPMEAKKTLAHALVEQYHGRAAAAAARAEFEQKFSKKDYSETADTLVVSGDIGLLDLVEKTGRFKSRSDMRRLIEQGGVSLDGNKITDPKARVTVRPGQILKAGKLVVVKLVVS
ncbi:MAG: tyrosine--tRNA ligase [Verrucomicrobia bacterium]|nr:tyrosine--tRNA ligase [Verrucomicrobiota bacterium]